MSQPGAVASQTKFRFTNEMLQKIAEHPHVLGWICGFPDLREIHSKWIKYIWKTKKGRALNAHRGSYKSTAIVYVGAVWYLLFNPNARVFIVRKTYEDAANAVATIARIMESPIIRELFKFAHREYPEFKVRSEGKLLFSFKRSLTDDVSITAFGLKSPFTGHHCDILICDDISTPKDRISRAEREFTKFMWRELSTNIIDRGKPCCYIGTPWHKEGVESLIKDILISFGIDDVGIMTPEMVEDARSKTTPSLFAANYLMQFVADDDALFKDPNITEKWPKNGLGRVEAHLDAAYGGMNSNALTIMAKEYATGKIRAKGYTFPGNVKDHLDEICKILAAYGCRTIHVEEQGDKGYVADMLKARNLNVKSYMESTNKQIKIGSYLYKYWPEIWWDPDSDDGYMMQVVDWTAETKENDDAPDSAACLLRAMFGRLEARKGRWAA